MGLMDRVKDQAAAAISPSSASAEAGRVGAQAGQQPFCDPKSHILTEVNKGSIRMQSWQAHLNDMHQRGYRLAHVFEQDGNTVQVFEHHHG